MNFEVAIICTQLHQGQNLTLLFYLIENHFTKHIAQKDLPLLKYNILILNLFIFNYWDLRLASVCYPYLD